MFEKMGNEKKLHGNVAVVIEAKLENLRHFRPRGTEEVPESAIVILAPIAGSEFTFRLLDQREDSITISRGVANIRTAEKRSKNLLDEEKVKRAKAEAEAGWPEYFGLHASVYLAFEEVGSRHYPLLVLRDPEEQEEEGMLSAIHLATGPKQGGFTMRESRESWCRKVRCRGREDGVNHFLIIAISAPSAPVMIIHRAIDGKNLVETDYVLTDTRSAIRREATITNEEWLEGKPLPEVATSFEEEALPADPRQHPLKDIDENINGDLEKYQQAGIQTVGELIDADPATVKKVTGLNLTVIRAHQKVARTYAEVLSQKE